MWKANWQVCYIGGTVVTFGARVETSVKRFAFGTMLAVLSMPKTAVSQQLGFDGVQPVRVGMTVPQAERALHVKLQIARPQDSDTSDCAFWFGRNLPSLYMVEHGRITRVDLAGRGLGSAVKTFRHIGLGSTIDEIKRAYGTRGKWHPNAYNDEPVFELKSADSKSAILLETEHGRVVHIVAGQLPSAEYIEGCE